MSASPAKHKKRYSIVISTGVKELQANHLSLYCPDLKELIEPLQKGLSSNFKNTEIKIIEKCPDLSAFGNLSTKGICGSCRLAEVGGRPYLYNKKYQKKTVYQLPDIVKTCGLQQALVIGTAHASPNIIGGNGELAVNTKVPGPRHTRYCKIDKIEPHSQEQHDDNKKEEKKEEKKQEPTIGPVVGFYPSEEIGCTSNLFLSDGKCDEPVLYIKVSIKTGKLTLISAIREALKKVKGVNGKQQIGIGGIIKVLKGKINGYISPEFIDCDFNDENKIKTSRNFYEFGPNLIMFSTILTDDPSTDKKLNLTMQNTSFYSLEKHCNEGGVFSDSATNETIEYEAYFSLARYIYRVEDAFYNLQHK
eukprot:180126_1